jgi:hypothetical protein
MMNQVFRYLACLLLVAFHVSCSPVNVQTPDNDNCTIEPEKLDLGAVLVGDYADETTALSITQWPPDNVSISSDHFSLIDPSTGDPTDTLDFSTWTEPPFNESYYETEIEIRFSPLSPGEKTCNINIDYSSGGIECPTLVADGVGIEVCGVDPAYLDFGVVEEGQSADLTTTLSVLAWPPDNPTIACNDFRFIDPITQEPSATLDFADPGYPYDHNQVTGVYSTELTIRFAPTNDGRKDCTVDFVKTADPAYDCPSLSLTGIGGVVTGQWTWFDPVTTYDLKDIYGDDDKVYACGDQGTVVYHNHGEANFNAWMSEDFDEMPLEAIWVTEMKDVWVGGGVVDAGFTYGRVFRYSESVEDWFEVDYIWQLDMVSSIWGNDQCDQYMGGPAISGMMPTLYNWNCIELSSEYLGLGYEKVTGIHGSGPENVWAVMDQYMYNVYHFDGEEWTLKREEWMDQALYDVWAAPGGNQVWAVGANGAIYRWNGTAWHDESIANETRTIFGIWGFSVVDIYAVGEDGLFYHYDGTWKELIVGGGRHP